MQLDKTLSFRKAITPWYDSNFTCWALILFMILVCLFAFCGIMVGLSSPDLQKHVWFPCFLEGLSLFLVTKVYVRLRHRSKNG